MQYRPIFITATNTDIGKTYVTCKLIEEFGKRGLKVGVFKPIETGVKEYPLDGKVLLECAKKTNPALKEFNFSDIVPIQFTLPAAPYVAKKKQGIDIEVLHKSFEKVARVSDVVLIEGAGGLMVPVDEKIFIYDFIKEFDAKALLVTHGDLGCINDTLLNLNLLDSLHVKYEWCVNLRDNKEHFEEVTRPYYQDRFDEILIVQDDISKIADRVLTF